MVRRDPEAVEQFLRLAASGNLADGQPVHRMPASLTAFIHRVADAARRVMILDRDDAAARGSSCGDERRRVDRRERNTDRSRESASPRPSSVVVGFQGLEDRSRRHATTVTTSFSALREEPSARQSENSSSAE